MATASSAPVLSTPTTYAKAAARLETAAPPTEHITAQYCLKDLAKTIVQEGYKRVALQFPDSLIPHSTVVALTLRNHVKEEQGGEEGDTLIFILGDTSYSECCVDEIAAQHVHADVVVHVGVSCLNPVVQAPVIYIFGKEKLDLKACAEVFKEHITNTDHHVIIVAESPFQAYVEQVKKLLSEYSNLLTTVPVLSSIQDPNLEAPKEIILPESLTHLTKTTHTHFSDIPHRAHPPLHADLGEYILFYIGIPPPPAQLHLSTVFSTAPIIFDPTTSSLQSQSILPLARRYRTMMTARAASTIGILVNTLSLRSSKKLIESLQDLVKQAGKKHYVVAVGKPNVAKLANFDVVDVWVVVGCPRGGVILDQEGQFYKPLVTPFELKLALKDEIVWGAGEWILEFEKVLNLRDDNDNDKDKEHSDANDNNGNDDEAGDLPPEFDPVTGKYVASRPLRSARRSTKHLDIEVEHNKSSEALISTKKNASQLIERGSQHYSTAAAYLQSSRFWKGLGSDFPENDETDEDLAQGAVLEEGRRGIARGYVNPE
ncbi:putative diphthamide synthesis protein-domain-containing protein [Lipomyces japonicus]|uniref:putative diphthamide synthesis protein-domain-containing protein n=1 Tax=Lipomyces japonicus TaxID=56871 RepID=UPI0034CDAEA3